MTWTLLNLFPTPKPPLCPFASIHTLPATTTRIGTQTCRWNCGKQKDVDILNVMVTFVQNAQGGEWVFDNIEEAAPSGQCHN